MKTIIIQWVQCSQEDIERYFYKTEMRVIYSDHYRFVKGSRFDFGFFSIATSEGYTIISLPIKID